MLSPCPGALPIPNPRCKHKIIQLHPINTPPPQAHANLLLAIHPRPEALGHPHRLVLLVPAILQQGGQDARHRQRRAVGRPGERGLAVNLGARAQPARLVVGADARRRHLAPVALARGEEGLHVDLADGAGAEVGRRHAEDAHVQAQRGQDLGLHVEHLVEDLLRGERLRGRPGEELDLCELVHAVQALCVGAAGPSFSTIAARDGDALEGEVVDVNGGVGLHPREGNLRRPRETHLRHPTLNVGGGLRNGVDLLLAVLVARLEPAGGANVAVHHARGRDLRPSVAGCCEEGVLDERLFELGGFAEEVVPSPAGCCRGAGKVEEAQLGADVDVGAPHLILGGVQKGRGFVDVAEDLKVVALGGIIAGQIRKLQRQLLHLRNSLTLALFNRRQLLLQHPRLVLNLLPTQLLDLLQILIITTRRRISQLPPQQIRPLPQRPSLLLQLLPLGVQLEDEGRVLGLALVVALQTGALVQLRVLPDVLDVDDGFWCAGRTLDVGKVTQLGARAQGARP